MCLYSQNKYVCNTPQSLPVNTSFCRCVNHFALCPTEWNYLSTAEQSLRFYASDFKPLPYQLLCDKKHMWDLVVITASLFAWKLCESHPSEVGAILPTKNLVPFNITALWYEVMKTVCNNATVTVAVNSPCFNVHEWHTWINLTGC